MSQKTIVEISRSVAFSCEQAETCTPAARLVWLIEAAEDAERMLDILSEEIGKEVAITRRERAEAQKQAAEKAFREAVE